MKNRGILISQLLFFMLFGSFGAFGSFINLYLEQVIGLTGSQIGTIILLGLITTVVMNPIWGYLADKTGKHVLLLKMGFLSSVIVGALYYSASNFLMILMVVVLFEALRAPIMGLLEFISTNYSEQYGYDYGKVRVFASVGFLIFAMLTGFLVAGMQLEFLGFMIAFDGVINLEFATFGIFLALNFIAFCLLFLLPKTEAQSHSTSSEQKQAFRRADVLHLLQNRRFLFILALTMIGFVTVDSAFSYSTMHLVTVLNAPENIVSWNALFMVTPELILLPIGTMLILRFGFKKWYIFSILTMMVRLFIYGYATNPFVFILGGVFHAIMIVMHISGTISYIRKVVPAPVLGLAFTILASSMAFSRGVLSFIFGWLYEINSFFVFRAAILIVLVALIMAIKSKSLNEVEKEKVII